jgi:hypothetical protein
VEHEACGATYQGEADAKAYSMSNGFLSQRPEQQSYWER